MVSENISNLLLTNHKIKSLNLIDSNITSRAMSNIRKALKDPKRHLISLSFKFSYLDTKNMFLLCDGLQVNRTLCKLDLSSNGLPPLSGIYVVRSLVENTHLSDLNLSKNNLNDDFAEELANCLRANEVVWRVDISYNLITERGGKSILKALREGNESLESLGDMEANPLMGICLIGDIQGCLEANMYVADGTDYHDKKKKVQTMEQMRSLMPISMQGQQEKRFPEDYRGDYTDYRICKPLNYHNNSIKTGANFDLWNI